MGNLLPALYGIDQNGLMPVLESVVVPYLQHCQVDIRPRTDLHFESRGQFYPPSGQSLIYYMDEFGSLDDVERSSDAGSELKGAVSIVGSTCLSDTTSSAPIYLLMPAD